MENDNYVTKKDLEKIYFVDMARYFPGNFTKEQIEDENKVVYENKEFLVAETKDGRIFTYGKNKLEDLF